MRSPLRLVLLALGLLVFLAGPSLLRYYTDWLWFGEVGYQQVFLTMIRSQGTLFSLAFIAATIWLVQKGSNESKALGDAGLESDEQQQIGPNSPTRGARWAKADDFHTRIYENSLLIVMTLIFFATWFGQSLNNWRVFNEEQATHDAPPVSWGSYLLDPDFWEKTLQNWQSEFLAVGTMVVFTIYLRQRGSPESKPVGAPHDETATSG